MGDTLEVLVVLVALYFFVLIYVIPAIIGIALVALVLQWTINKFAAHGEPNDDIEDHPLYCAICGDVEDWHRHAP
jgi:hypothetical protein